MAPRLIPPNLKIYAGGHWNERMLVETVLSMLTTVGHLKRFAHRIAEHLQARLAFTLALFNVLAQWHGLSRAADRPDPDTGFVPLSIAEFSF